MNTRPKKKTASGPPILSKAKVDSGNLTSADPKHSPFITREAVESIVVAILLALLFRGFEAEAFIIPTGSMAPTLQGRHKDVQCPQCNYQYRVGDTEAQGRGQIAHTSCPMCQFQLAMDPNTRNHATFNGDRILVNKFIYQFVEPKRWDVIVFKYPGNAKQNYIKRLVGLPGEHLKIHSGDVFVKQPNEDDYVIARKPAEKLPHLLHLVHDTRYVPAKLASVGWPSAWHAKETGWSTSADQKNYRLTKNNQLEWLRYRHLLPDHREWAAIENDRLPALGDRQGELITDFYTYNISSASPWTGWHWVGDLAMEFAAKVTSESGELRLEAIEGGHRLTCRIDVASGHAEIQIDDGAVRFDPVDSKDTSSRPDKLTAETSIRGSGTYRIMWSNVDDQLLLWVNRRPVDFTVDGQPHPGHFTFETTPTPRWSTTDAGDLFPLSIGGKELDVELTNLRVYRDVYYVAADSTLGNVVDYTSPGYNGSPDLHGLRMELDSLFRTPAAWDTSPWFRNRREAKFQLEADQFFPMGDNSPASKDARLWAGKSPSYAGLRESFVDVPPYVERRLLIGKAFLVYWPHGWYTGVLPLPFLPNLDRMGRIH